MLNQVVIVGRLVEDPKVEKGDNHNYSFLRLAVPRSYKNADGEYEKDLISCVLFGNIAKNTAEYCKKGDIIGVKGRVETSVYEKDGDKKYEQSIVAEKVTFLSSKSHDKEEETSKDNDDLDM